MNAIFQPTVPVTKTETTRPAKPKILLVDDDPAMRRVLFRLLADEDFMVMTAADSGEALELANLTKFDLVLLDLKTQAETEWRTYGQLSAQHPLLPVILITDRSNPFFHAVAPGVDALLERPLNFTRLFHTIHDLLEEPVEERLACFKERLVMLYATPSHADVLQKVWRVN
jgi:two-component system, OmpR family, response regulator